MANIGSDGSLDELIETLCRQDVSLWLEDNQVRFHCRQGSLDATLRATLSANRTPLVERLSTLDGRGIGMPLLRRARLDTTHRLLFLQDMSVELYTPGAQARLHLVGRKRLIGSLDIGKLRSCVEDLVRRHAILRATIAPGDVWRRSLSISAALCVDIEMLAPGSDALKSFEHRPFDLERGPLFRFGVLSETNDRHLVTLVLQHAIADGLSVSLAWLEILRRYEALVSGKAVPLPELPFQFPDVMRYRHEWNHSIAAKQARAYWRDKLSDCADPFTLPYDPMPCADRPQSPNPPQGALNETDFNDLSQVAKTYQLTLANLTLGAFAIALSRWSGRSEIVSWVAHSGRRRRESFRLIGCFADHWLLRVFLPPHSTTLEGLRAVSAAANEAQWAIELPGVDIAAQFTAIPGESLDRIIIFNFMPSGKLDSSTGPEHIAVEDNLFAESVEPSTPSAYTESGSRIALMTTVYASATGIHWAVRYDPDCFSTTSAEAFCFALGTVLRQASSINKNTGSIT